MSEATTVVCSRYKEELPAISSRITFAGDLGDRIKREVSQRAWNDWLEMQIKLINEYRLHMGEAAHREALKEYAGKFFCFDGGDGSLGPEQGPEGGL